MDSYVFFLVANQWVRSQDGVFTIISGVRTITISFPIQTSLQLYGYLVSPAGGQNHMKMNARPWGTLETALHLWARFTHLNIAGRARRPKTSPGTSDCTGAAAPGRGKPNHSACGQQMGAFAGITIMRGPSWDSDLRTRDARRPATYQTAPLSKDFSHMTFKDPVGHQCR